MEYSKVIDGLNTTLERNRLSMALGELQAGLYKADDQTYEMAFSRSVPVNLADSLRRALPEGREAKDNYLRGLKEELKNLPVVTLVMAMHPTEAFLTEMVDQVRQRVGERAIVDIKVRRMILGGARVEYEGRFKDYSVRGKLARVLKEEEQRITSLRTIEQKGFDDRV